jgi:hypothetical protein
MFRVFDPEEKLIFHVKTLVRTPDLSQRLRRFLRS